MPKYSLDPRWMTARFSSTCSKCDQPIAKGADIFYYPNGKRALCKTCGDDVSREFAAMAFDEDNR